jgi:hypothetical protein
MREPFQMDLEENPGVYFLRREKTRAEYRSDPNCFFIEDTFVFNSLRSAEGHGAEGRQTKKKQFTGPGAI